ncbi:T9SS type A sorting domain-containing protein [Arcicella sp. DC2W]|uniref:T9SS type A sorting domain-containing protein n=1 Tax=Arcicella gelida TaxID=2984195 RepID=A0ABU5S814_9BACT|nr:T9SS type A sorting domain-containing protein [Arcicella sp. DC2W]MEA5404618.1 T9SS type A sorting domain-containing protein [Arcicella sp. DC2W]
MKKILSLFVITVFSQWSFSQTNATILTPKGSFVSDAVHPQEISQNDINTINSYYDNYVVGPSAQRIGSATKSYNCHGYAWFNADGGSRVWIGYYGDTAEDIFWNDGSYVSSGITSGAKVSFSGNHSAIVTSDSQWFISKWGLEPLMRHRDNYYPNGYGSIVGYYVKSCNSSPYFTPEIMVNNQPASSNTNVCNYATLSWSNNQSASYTWQFDPISLSSNGSLSPSGGWCNVNIWGSFVRIRSTISNSCGSGSFFFYLYNCGNGYSSYVVYPNPAVEEITVEFKDSDSNLVENEVKNFKIFDEKGNLVKEITGNDSLMEENKVKINTSDLKKGTYYLHFNAKNQDIKRHKIIID